jgi:hypothetical protein
LADATAKTRSLIEDLQARLTGEGSSGGPDRPRHSSRRESVAVKETVAEEMSAKEVPPDTTAKDETEEDLERQLQAYFDSLNESGQRAPAVPASSPAYKMDDIRARVIDGVVERILEAWSHPEHGGAAGAAIRHEVVERLTDRMLEMLQRVAADKSGAVAKATASA